MNKINRQSVQANDASEGCIRQKPMYNQKWPQLWYRPNKSEKGPSLVPKFPHWPTFMGLPLDPLPQILSLLPQLIHRALQVPQQRSSSLSE